MLERFRRAKYLVALKWKQGEARALSTIPRVVRDDILVMFDVPPAGDYDHELGRTLEPTEHIKLFGTRLERHCGSHPAFIDARLVDDARHKEGLTVHPLTELLERARLAGARPCPVTGLGRPAEYQAAVARFVSTHAPMPVCVRLAAGELENPFLRDELAELLATIGCEPGRVMLVVDFAGQQLGADDIEPFAELLSNRLNELPLLHDWLNVAVLMTGFPDSIPLKAGQSRRYLRSEWLVFQKLIDLGDRVLRRPIFADYAVEFPSRYVTGQATPVAQMRYSSGGAYLVLKGLTTKKPNGYGVIREVAARLVSESEFEGPSYSAGDSFIDRLARSIGSTGNASTWRWAWTDHHLMVVWKGVRALLGLSTEIAGAESQLENQQLPL